MSLIEMVIVNCDIPEWEKKIFLSTARADARDTDLSATNDHFFLLRALG